MATDFDVRVDGWRLKLGKINHSACDYPNNYTTLVPAGVKVVAMPLGVQVFDEADHLADARDRRRAAAEALDAWGVDCLADARERRRAAAEALDAWGVDCVLAGGGPTNALEGHEAEQAFIEEMNDRLDVPFTTSLEAQVDALRALGAERLVAVTPFPDDRERETAAYLEARGFDIVTIGGPVATGSSSARRLHPSTSYQFATRLARRTEEEFDAVYIAGSPFGSADHIAPLEEDTGRPVVISAAAQVWKAFQFGGIDPDMSGFGRLFEV